LKFSQGLGGKAGERVIELFQVEYLGQLRRYSLDVLQTSMGDKDGCWLYNLIRGIETTPVSNRNLYKTISASKNFPGKTSLDTNEKVRKSSKFDGLK
jgi:DNA polymerase eta